MSEDFLAAHWKPDEVDLPPWSSSKGDTAGASLTSVKPRHDGLVFQVTGEDEYYGFDRVHHS